MMKKALSCTLVLLWLTLMILRSGSVLSAAETEATAYSSQVSAKDKSVIGRSTNSVWFDAEDGTVHPTRNSKPINVDDRHDSIAGPVTRRTSTWWTSFWSTVGDFFSWMFRGWQILLIIGLLVFLSVVGFIIFRNGFRFQVVTNKSTDKSVLEREKAKLLDLPFEVEQTMFGLLAQAERYRAAGDYSKAVIYLFSHALVEMDGARCIRLERGKTNRVYLRELRDRDQLQGFTNQLVVAFEYAFFGKHILSQEAFERIWQQLPAFDDHLKAVVSKPNTVLGALAARGS
jgi:hypothetical protein